MDNKKLYQKAFDSVTISDSAVESLNKSLDMKKSPKNPVRILRFVPVMAIILTMGITVAAVSFSNRDTVENIYFDRDIRGKYIAEINPAYRTYMTDEGIEQLESFKPIALDVTDHSGNGNDLKSATLLGVMADKYTLTALAELTFNEEVPVPENNVAGAEAHESGAVTFLSNIAEEGDYIDGEYNLYVLSYGELEGYRKYFSDLLPIPRHPDPYISCGWQDNGGTRISISPVAGKPDTVILFIENVRTWADDYIKENSTVRFTFDKLGTGNSETKLWETLIDGKYVFDIPTPKKLIPEKKIKVNKEFVVGNCKYNIEKLERSQSYIKIDYTCAVLPEYYEVNKVDMEISSKNRGYEIKTKIPTTGVLSSEGRNIPIGFDGNCGGGWGLKELYAGNSYPDFDPEAKHSAILIFKKPQNDESLGELVFYDSSWDYKGKELLTIPLK